MKLNKNEEKILTDFGCTLQDIAQIKRLRYEFTLCSKDGTEEKVSMEKAKEELSENDFLSGIERAAFHRTSYRETINKKYKGILIESNLGNY